MYKMQLEYKS